MNLEFINGRATVKNGRRIVGRVYNRPIWYKHNNIPAKYSDKYPFSIEIGVGIRECETLEECITYLKKYTD